MADDQTRRRDVWERVGFMLQSGGGLLTAVTVAVIGFFTSSYLKEKELSDTVSRERMQAYETNVRIYTELMSKREESESALRKDMFVSIIQSFMHPGSSSLDERILNLELLSYNFHESLNLKPLFSYMERQVESDGAQRKEYLQRLYKMATEITRKQMLVLEGVGAKVDRLLDLSALEGNHGGVPIDPARLTVDGVTREFQLVLLEADPKSRSLRMRLDIRTAADSAAAGETNSAEFWTGYFDFPMIDNTRLTHDQRCAVVLNAFEDGAADITLAYFPGAYASLKEKPYYQEVVQSLMRTNEQLAPRAAGRDDARR